LNFLLLTEGMEYRNLPVLLFKTPDEWRSWLEANHQSETGVWLQFAKKNAPLQSINYDQALEEALCFGWIDSLLQKYDDQSYLQKFSPRKPNSIWSKKNTEHIEQLVERKKMHPAGLAMVEAAKQSGRWQTAYDKPADMKVPTDFLVALEKKPKAKAFFETLNKANTYAIAWRLQTAQKPETRQKRLQKLIEMMENGQSLH
jgi:uncharacterized protein YdeI (YjbR/CyaY-like superfamily)